MVETISNNQVPAETALSKQEALEQLQSGEQSTAQLNDRVAEILDNILHMAKNGHDIELSEVEERIESLLDNNAEVEQLIKQAHIPELADELLDKNHGKEITKQAAFDEVEHKELLAQKIEEHPHLKERHANLKNKIVDHLHEHVVRKNVLYFGGVEKMGDQGPKGKIAENGRIIYNISFFYNLAKDICQQNGASLDYFQQNSVEDAFNELQTLEFRRFFVRFLNQISDDKEIKDKVKEQILAEMHKVKSHEVTHRLVRLLGREHGFEDLEKADINGRDLNQEYQNYQANKEDYHHMVINLLEEDKLSVANLTNMMVTEFGLNYAEGQRSAQLVIDELMAEIIEDNLESVIKSWSPEQNPEVENNLKHFIINFFQPLLDKARENGWLKGELDLDEEFVWLQKNIRRMDTKELFNLENKLEEFAGAERFASFSELLEGDAVNLIDNIQKKSNLKQLESHILRLMSGEITNLNDFQSLDITSFVNNLNAKISWGGNLTEEQFKECLVAVRIEGVSDLVSLLQVIDYSEKELKITGVTRKAVEKDIDDVRKQWNTSYQSRTSIYLLLGNTIERLVKEEKQTIQTEINSTSEVEEIEAILTKHSGNFENINKLDDILERAKKAVDEGNYDISLDRLNSEIWVYGVNLRNKINELIDKKKREIQEKINNAESIEAIWEVLNDNADYFEKNDEFNHIANNARTAIDQAEYECYLDQLDSEVTTYGIELKDNIKKLIDKMKKEIQEEINNAKLEDIEGVMGKYKEYFRDINSFSSAFNDAKKAKNNTHYNLCLNNLAINTSTYWFELKDKIKELINKKKREIQEEIEAISNSRMEEYRGERREVKVGTDEMLNQIKWIVDSNADYFNNVNSFEDFVNNAKNATNEADYSNALDALDSSIASHSILLTPKTKEIIDQHHVERITEAIEEITDLEELKNCICNDENKRYFNNPTAIDFGWKLDSVVKEGEGMEIFNEFENNIPIKEKIRKITNKVFKDSLNKASNLDELQSLLNEYDLITNVRNIKDKIENGEYISFQDLASKNKIISSKEDLGESELKTVLDKVNELSIGNSLWNKVVAVEWAYKDIAEFADLKDIRMIIKRLVEEIDSVDEKVFTDKDKILEEYFKRIWKAVKYKGSNDVIKNFLNWRLWLPEVLKLTNVSEDVSVISDKVNQTLVPLYEEIQELEKKVKNWTVTRQEQECLDKKTKELRRLQWELTNFSEDISSSDIEKFGLDNFEKRKIFVDHRVKIMQSLESIKRDYAEKLKTAEKEIEATVAERKELDKRKNLLRNITSLSSTRIKEDKNYKEFLASDDVFWIDKNNHSIENVFVENNIIYLEYTDKEGNVYRPTGVPVSRVGRRLYLQEGEIMAKEKVKDELVYQKDQFIKEKAKKMFNDDYYQKYREWSRLETGWQAIKNFARWDEDKDKDVGTILADSVVFWAKFSVYGPGGMKKVWDVMKTTFGEQSESRKIEMAKYSSDIVTTGMDRYTYGGFMRGFLGATSKQGMKFEAEREKKVLEEIDNKYPEWGQSMQSFNNTNIPKGVAELLKIKSDEDDTSKKTRSMLIGKIAGSMDAGVDMNIVADFKEIMYEYFMMADTDSSKLEKMWLDPIQIKDLVWSLPRKNAFFSDTQFWPGGVIVGMGSTIDATNYKKYAYNVDVKKDNAHPDYLKGFYAKYVTDVVKYLNTPKVKDKLYDRISVDYDKNWNSFPYYSLNALEQDNDFMEDMAKELGIIRKHVSLISIASILQLDAGFRSELTAPIRQSMRDHDENELFINGVNLRNGSVEMNRFAQNIDAKMKEKILKDEYKILKPNSEN